MCVPIIHVHYVAVIILMYSAAHAASPSSPGSRYCWITFKRDYTNTRQIHNHGSPGFAHANLLPQWAVGWGCSSRFSPISILHFLGPLYLNKGTGEQQNCFGIIREDMHRKQTCCLTDEPLFLPCFCLFFLVSTINGSVVEIKGAGVVYTVCLSSCCPFAHQFYLLDGIIVSWDIVTYKWYRRSWLICRDKLIQVDGLIFEFPNENLALQSNLYPP